jgi:light-regulated signal transduction histidine kinase (bacteriophytochrome)
MTVVDHEAMSVPGRTVTRGRADLLGAQRRTRELEERVAELERSNRELERFACDAAHDLAEPLRAMSWSAARLGSELGGELTRESRRLLTSICDGAERMQMLVTDLLAYSRASDEPLALDHVETAELLRSTLELLAETIEEKGASVSSDRLPAVDADRVQLEQVFRNLVCNALKYGDGGPVEVHVGATRGDGEWRFFVRDNGVGVDPVQADHIFGLFRRGHRDLYAGTGIGLAICKRVIERHGGRIWVDPAPGGGSVFQFTVRDAARRAATPHTRSGASATGNGRGE